MNQGLIPAFSSGDRRGNFADFRSAETIFRWKKDQFPPFSHGVSFSFHKGEKAVVDYIFSPFLAGKLTGLSTNGLVIIILTIARKSISAEGDLHPLTAPAGAESSE